MDTRQRILDVTAALLQAAQGEPVSTRAICEAAGVSAPTLYHHFTDKDALLDAVVAHGFESYLSAKRGVPSTGDVVEDLRHGWDAHVEFGVTHPALYTLMYGTGRSGPTPPAAIGVRVVLVGLLQKVAASGRLAVSVDLAASMIEAAVVGVTLQAIGKGVDPAVSAQVREAMLASLLSAPTAAGSASPGGRRGRAARRGGTPAAAIATAASELAALLQIDGRHTALTGAERDLLGQWLRTLAGARMPSATGPTRAELL